MKNPPCCILHVVCETAKNAEGENISQSACDSTTIPIKRPEMVHDTCKHRAAAYGMMQITSDCGKVIFRILFFHISPHHFPLSTLPVFNICGKVWKIHKMALLCGFLMLIICGIQTVAGHLSTFSRFFHIVDSLSTIFPHCALCGKVCFY